MHLCTFKDRFQIVFIYRKYVLTVFAIVLKNNTLVSLNFVTKTKSY